MIFFPKITSPVRRVDTVFFSQYLEGFWATRKKVVPRDALNPKATGIFAETSASSASLVPLHQVLYTWTWLCEEMGWFKHCNRNLFIHFNSVTNDQYYLYYLSLVFKIC